MKKVFFEYLMSPTKECPTGVAYDAAVVQGVLLIGFGHLLADVADNQVVVGTRIGRRTSRLLRFVVGHDGIAVAEVVLTILPMSGICHHRCH